MKILILAAGFGVRLKPFTLFCSKSLLRIGRKRMIDFVIDSLNKIGENTYYIVTTHKHCRKFEKWALTRSESITLLCNGVVKEKDKHGAIRDLAWSLLFIGIDEPILVVGGDNLFFFDLNLFLDFVKKEPNISAVALHELENIELAKLYGSAEMEKEVVKKIHEKSQNPPSKLIAMCLYYLVPRDLVSAISFAKNLGHLDAVGHFIGYLALNSKLRGYNYGQTDWIDIGNCTQYWKAWKKVIYNR